LQRLNTYIIMCWDRVFEQADASPAPTLLEANVRALTALYGASPVVTRLTRETARLQRQIAALERQLVYVHKHFHAQPIPDIHEPVPMPPVENEPAVTTTESDPAVIAAYRSQFPNHRIIILPASHAANEDDDHIQRPPVPRRAA
ncbi:MAG TPA: hypothetical protein VFQ91_07900, partial [Bryobacteraceae bacterium]|nr:hypothetical protein [Bryobacteraceae bacterium]